MTASEVINSYKSKEEKLRKLDSCDYCPFEQILRDKYSEAGVLSQDIPSENHPHRGTIEDICGKDVDDPCAMKYAIMRTSLSDYNLAQFEAVETFKLDLTKNSNIQLDRNEAYAEWAKKRKSLSDSQGNQTSFAKRWEEVWGLSLCMNGHHSLSEIGMYRIVVSPNSEYEQEIGALKTLSRRERLRHIAGINPEDKD